MQLEKEEIVRILFIEPDKKSHDILVGLLKDWFQDYVEIVWRSIYENGITELKKGNFDLIISDIKMPEMDGVEALKKIRAHLILNNRKLIPEIIITGYAKEKIYQDALALKAAAYIEKPFDMQPLLEAISNLIGICR